MRADSSAKVGGDLTTHAALTTTAHGGVANTYNLRGGLREWKRRVVLGGVLDVVCLGTSIGAGYSATDRSTQGFAKLVAAGLKATHGDGGTGIVTPMNEGVITPAVTYSAGDWKDADTINFYGSSTKYKQPLVSGTGTATLVAAGTTSWTIYQYESGGTGRSSISIDGGAGTLVGHAGSGSGIQIDTVATAGGTCVLTVPAATASLLLAGIAANKGTTGVRFHHMAFSGKSTADISAYMISLIAAINPALLILPFATNEYKGQQTLATFSTNLTAAINALKTANGATTLGIGGSVLCVAEPLRSENNLAIPQWQYSDQMQKVAVANNCAMLDIGERWVSGAAAVTAGLLDADGIHPLTAGHASIATAILAAIAGA